MAVMMDTLNYKYEEDMLHGLSLLLARGVTQFQVALHQNGLWAVSFPPQEKPIVDDNSEDVA